MKEIQQGNLLRKLKDSTMVPGIATSLTKNFISTNWPLSGKGGYSWTLSVLERSTGSGDPPEITFRGWQNSFGQFWGNFEGNGGQFSFFKEHTPKERFQDKVTYRSDRQVGQAMIKILWKATKRQQVVARHQLKHLVRLSPLQIGQNGPKTAESSDSALQEVWKSTEVGRSSAREPSRSRGSRGDQRAHFCSCGDGKRFW